MKKILFLPFLFFLLIALLKLISGDFFAFFGWAILSILVALIFFPIALNSKDQEVPIIQIFTSLIVIYLFFSIAIFFDFKNLLGYSNEESLLYGFLSGFVAIAIVMTLKGK